MAMNQSFCIPISATAEPFDLSPRCRSIIVVVVALVHVILLWFWVTMPEIPKPVQREMAVSIVMPSPPPVVPVEPKPAPPPPQVKPKPVEPQQVKPAPKIAEPVAKPVETAMPVEPVAPAAPVMPVAAPAPTPPAVESAPVQPVKAPVALPDREPDYHAAYLNNPKPKYPMVARRMGWQGKVVLNVEVLASGLPGHIKIHQSSGHDVLDNDALNAVQTWRFVPARHNGEEVTRNFLVPIPFKLEQ